MICEYGTSIRETVVVSSISSRLGLYPGELKKVFSLYSFEPFDAN